MTAYKCDRCAGFYSGHPDLSITENAESMYEQKYELCSDCAASWTRWMKCQNG